MNEQDANEPCATLPCSLPALTSEDRQALRRAYAQLENPGLAARLTNKLGRPIEKIFQMLPDGWYESLHRAMRANLEKALAVAVVSMDQKGGSRHSARVHRWLGMMSGAVGGFFGLPAVLAELPVISTIILRSIADIARSEGEDPRAEATRLACLEVFALGGRGHGYDATDAGYYGIRLALGLHFTLVSEQVASRGIVRWSPPALVRFMAEIAARFGVAVTQKAAVQMVPVLGAGAGGLVNLVFIEHFQEVARAHFTMRRLERVYGLELMRAEYEKLSLDKGKKVE